MEMLLPTEGKVWELLVGVASLALLVGLPAVHSAGQELLARGTFRVLWQIGEFDNSPNEFALAPDGARKFTQRFPAEVVYTVGQSTPADWPFIHPNSADTAWGGKPTHPFTIRFPLERVPEGDSALLIDLFDVHERLAPQLEVTLNGEKVFSRRLPLGSGRAYYGPCPGAEQVLLVPLPRERLRPGKNELVLTLHDGSWVAYDALALVHSPPTLPAVSAPPPPMQPTPLSLATLTFATPQDAERWTSSLSLAAVSEGRWHLLGLQADQAVEWPDPLVVAQFTVEFDFWPCAGEWKFSFVAPNARRAYWEVAWGEAGLQCCGEKPVPLTPGEWYHLRVDSAPEGGQVTLRTAAGQDLGSWNLPRTFGPPGHLRLACREQFAECYLANFHLTTPVALTLDQVAYGATEPVHALLTCPVEAPLQVHTALTDTAGQIRWTKKYPLPPQASLLNLDFRLPPLADGTYTLTCTLVSEGGQELTQVSTPLTVAEAARREAEAALRALKEAFAGKLPDSIGDWFVWKAEGALAKGEFRWATKWAERGRAALTAVNRLAPETAVNRLTSGFEVQNSAWRLRVDLTKGLNPCRLEHRPTGQVFADADYSYSFGRPQEATYQMEEAEDGTLTLTLRGRVGTLEVTHTFRFPAAAPYFEEQLTLHNAGAEPIDLPDLRCGFVRTLPWVGRHLSSEVADWRLVAVPYRREPMGTTGQYEDYNLADIVRQKGWYRRSWREGRRSSPQFGSEGWAWTDGRQGMLVVKYSQDLMEFSLLDAVPTERGDALRFGGGGIWHGDPEAAARLEPGERVALGVTRYLAYQGGWLEGFAQFRAFMDEKGHGTPPGFDPPVHWNELYDNPLWWGPDTPERRQQLYTLEAMKEEAAKARQFGCEALYLDPGWDTSFASTIWAADRLLPFPDFVRLLREGYGLKVSLHTPLAGWSDARAYPREADRMDAQGNIIKYSLCSASRAYLDTKAERLLKLAAEGAAYFMFDGSAYTGPCYHPEHGHSLPLTREEHVRAYLGLARRIHEQFPQVLIELHDPVVAGVPIVYVPTYYGHGAGSYDENWGFELMWHPLDDLLSGRAIALYYYNLAYGLPLYLHVDLRSDNEHALMLWWNISTVRHLGIGGTHPNPRVRAAQLRAMRLYRRLKPFYTQGVFYGLEEEVHVHTLPERNSAVVNVFNLSERPVTKEVVLDLAPVGLNPTAEYVVTGAPARREGNRLILTFDLPAHAPALAEIWPSPHS
ncbi:MAG TPA: hypothetical protein EYP85_10950 [Armatimonadetes bacterium]|nr:hypothetical protein [Armatimonadota bacterium]